MDASVVGIIGIFVLFIAFFMGMPVGFAMMIIGTAGLTYLTSLPAAMQTIGATVYNVFSDYNLAVIPLFMMMAEFTYYSGMSGDLYSAAYRWFGQLKGGLAISTIGGCAGFAAICGSSTATMAAMSTIALPEMKKYKYNIELAAGTLASGGTLGILIPPSIGFVIYGIVTQTPIGPLFLAGFFPGMLLSFLFIITIILLTHINPNLGPSGPHVKFGEKLASLKYIWRILILFLIVIGGIYLGVFTATEAAAFGASGSLVICLARKLMNWQNFKESLLRAGQTSAMIFVLILGATVFSIFLARTRIPFMMADWLSGLEVSKYCILGMVLFIYLILGCFMDIFSMIIMTTPIIFPIIIALEFDPIWYGVVMVVVMELGLITPPFGMNLFVMQGILTDISLLKISRGTTPFIICIILCIIILTVFPDIATFLPSMMAK